MRLLYTLFTLAAFGSGICWVLEKNPDLKQKAQEYLDFQVIYALETRFDASQVVEMHQKKLIKEKGARFLDSELKFFPYLLMEVKYSDRKGRTKESLMLWDLAEGELVLDFKNWEKTHGFADCILYHTQPHEFKLLLALSEKESGCDTPTLLNKLGIEMPILEAMIQGCIRKNLIIQSGGGKYRLHLENPRLTNIPETKLEGQLTTCVHRRVDKVKKHFSPPQIGRMTKMAFGENFSIRKMTEVHLPIHRILIQKADGSIQIFHFNALTGRELPRAPFYE